MRTLIHSLRLLALIWRLRQTRIMPIAGHLLPRGPSRWLLRIILGGSGENAPRRPGQRLAALLQDLGPSFVKLGQSLATRGDLLGEDVAIDLRQLQDRLPPFSARLARQMVERELHAPIDTLFSTFDNTPVAAASIAQVHKATTADGRVLAVKIVRPGIEAAIERDLAFFAWAAGLIERLMPGLRRFKPMANVAVFAAATRRELDLRLEAAAASELGQNCADDEGFRVPAVDWQRTGQRVASFEFIEGLPVTDRKALIDAGHDPSEIMRNAARVFFNQVFRDGFFHGDMHHGNMLIDAKGCIVALDFGIMGRVSEEDRRCLAEILVGFLAADYGRVADSFIRAGFMTDDSERDALMQACRAIGEPIQGLAISEISFGRLLGQLLAIARQFDVEMQPQFLILQKTMVVSEGVGRMLDPKINMWTTTRPLVEAWIVEHLGPAAQFRRGARELEATARLLPQLVARLDTHLREPHRKALYHVDHGLGHVLSYLVMGAVIGALTAWGLAFWHFTSSGQSF